MSDDPDPVSGLSDHAKAKIFDAIYKLLRHTGTFIGGAFVAHGYFTATTETTLIGIVSTVLGYGASLLAGNDKSI